MANTASDSFNMGPMMGPMMGVMMGVMMLAIIPTMLQAAVPQKDFVCPICGEAFYTQAELENHFGSAHPSEPIEIIWS